MTSGSASLVIWEWMEDDGKWMPYKPKICWELEKALSSGAQKMVDLTIRGQHRSLRYKVDVAKMIQISAIRNTRRPVKRRNLPSSSVLAKQHMWMWNNGTGNRPLWTPYSSELIEEIEKEYQNNSPSFDLQRFGLPYRLDFTNNTQENVNTHFPRGIKRKQLKSSYPLDSGATPTSSIISTPQHIMPRHYAGHPHGPAYGHHHSRPGMAGPYPGFHHSRPGVAGPYLTQTHGPAYGHQQTHLGMARPYLTPPHSQTYGHQPGVAQPPNFNPVNGVLGPAPSNVQRNHMPFIPPSIPSTSNPMSILSSNPQPNPPTSGATKRKLVKNVNLPPCPTNGIPSSTSASGGNVPVTEVLKNFTKPSQVDASSTDQCPICQTNLTDESGFGNSKETCELLLCKHNFHRECIEAAYSSGVQNGCIVCPSCTKMHGIKTGNQPPGAMHYTASPSSLPGNPGCGTLRITYSIQPGVQTSEHPHPGRAFRTPAFPRIAYLPDNDDGRRVLLLLIEAWKRRLIFTVGHSHTSGQDDVVTWTSIHHKTQTHSHGSYGYPDATYFDRVLDELAAVGVVDAP